MLRKIQNAIVIILFAPFVLPVLFLMGLFFLLLNFKLLPFDDYEAYNQDQEKEDEM